MSALTLRRGFLPSIAGNLFDTVKVFGPKFWDFNGGFDELDLSTNVPSVNIIENNVDFKIEVAAPGLEKKDFKVEVEDGVLTISAEKNEEKTEEKENYSRKEFSYNCFSRSFRLPENCKPDKIEARYDNGILRLSLPKKEVAVKKVPKQVKVS